jgi:NADH-quinone oxidoreductase subunit L
VLLAIASVLAGLIAGWPPEQGFIHQFLGPVFAHGEAAEHHIEPLSVLIKSAIATIVSLGGIWLAYAMYVRGSIDSVAMGERFRGLFRTLANKWYFDEIYDALFVRQTFSLSRGIWLVDQYVIDGLVNGTAALVAGVSGQLRKVQTGFVGNYALAIAFGMVLFVGIYLITASLR